MLQLDLSFAKVLNFTPNRDRTLATRGTPTTTANLPALNNLPNEARKANQQAIVAEKKRMEPRTESRGSLSKSS
ncbi:hypothetical protein E2562_038684 [Oryza meyeriana var. granulata]|uniref:Uncharacterized protein n=1 Tax=Oryza meyeriana var. granulata TaxID=110450 RepID=A0A6G1CXS2_9ORYZ|nr:hypothetical protein E2562_038684 [Oryza meyeriana var. granulata]